MVLAERVSLSVQASTRHLIKVVLESHTEMHSSTHPFVLRSVLPRLSHTDIALIALE